MKAKWMLLAAVLAGCANQPPVTVPVTVPPDTVMDCELTSVGPESTTVVCEDATILDIPLTEWHTFEVWTQPPVLGLILKAARNAEGNMYSVADCETRTREAIEAYCGGMYCRPPINSLTPDDCL